MQALNFLAVCRYKTGSRAAEVIYITQPSLSTRLKTLENELGGPLFHRKKGCREMTLTTAGKAFYELAVQNVAWVLLAADGMRSLFGQTSGHIARNSGYGA